eukprot:9482137-Pyramimonas_sp.AAC.1
MANAPGGMPFAFHRHPVESIAPRGPRWKGDGSGNRALSGGKETGMRRRWMRRGVMEEDEEEEE